MNLLYNAIIPLISALIGGLFALWIYREGLKKEKREQRHERIRENYETEIYFFSNLKSILFFIDKQIDEIAKISQETKKWNSKNMNLALMSELKMTELRDLNFKTLFQILVIDRDGSIKEKSSDFINLKNCLHNIEDFIESQQVAIPQFYQSQIENINVWNDGLKSLTQIYNGIAINHSTNDSQLIKGLNECLVQKQREILNNGNSNNMKIVYDQVICPLRSHIYGIENKKDARILPILENLMICEKAFQQVKILRFNRRKSLLIAGRRLNQVKLLLKHSLENIEERKKRLEE